LTKGAFDSATPLFMCLKNWDLYIEKNLFRNHAGFYELPYLANNPQLMVNSILKLPVSRHNPEEQAIYTDNQFINGVIRYHKIEEGLWLMATYFDIKKNMVCRALYDDEVVSDHYFLSFAVFEYKFPTNDNFTRFVTLLSTTCTFYKPNTEVDTYFYENTSGKFYNIVFSRQWAKQNLAFSSKKHKNDLQAFINTETGFINWLDIVPDAENLSNKLWEMTAGLQSHEFDTNNLQKNIIKIITAFAQATNNDKRLKNYPQLSNTDYAGVAKAECIILKNLMNQFLGVKNISKLVNMCPTKLKAVFKTVFGFSMLQYHKEKNMLLAQQLIKNSTMQIKNIALLTGFESASKFTATFKKRFNKLPSAFKTN
jgi:AraC-like DNA-binding protein